MSISSLLRGVRDLTVLGLLVWSAAHYFCLMQKYTCSHGFPHAPVPSGMEGIVHMALSAGY